MDFYARLIIGLSFAIVSILSLYLRNKRPESYKTSKPKLAKIIYIPMFLTGIYWIITAFIY